MEENNNHIYSHKFMETNYSIRENNKQPCISQTMNNINSEIDKKEKP